MEIPNIIKADSPTWNASVCVNFCDQFLSHVKKVVQEDNPRLVYLFTWRPNCPVTHTVHRDSENSFLPDWYTQSFQTT
ncbi:decapping and exoribonuclease protein-like [Branchiostoma floridae]|nr:decapping and exoribonuclease protein-like [Branchiostoma floridae]